MILAQLRLGRAFASSGPITRGFLQPRSGRCILVYPKNGNGFSWNSRMFTQSNRQIKISEPGGEYISPLARLGIYSQVDIHVRPIYGNEGNPFVGLLLLTIINAGVFVLWNAADKDDPEKFDAHRDFMYRNFTCDLTNVREGRLWVLLTASFSHQNAGHLFGNLLALWLFGFQTYRVLSGGVRGNPGFFCLYALGGVVASAAHIAFSSVSGRTDPPLSSHEERAMERYLEMVQERTGKPAGLDALPKEQQLRIQNADQPGLGASGSVMAITTASACLFPWDAVWMRGFMLPLPVAASIYVASDVMGLTHSTSSNIGHAAHLGGSLVGVLFVSYLWRGRGPLPVIRWMRGAPHGQ